MKTENKLNRIFGLFLVLTTALSMNVSAMPGDVNGDGTVTMSDANVVVNYYLATTKPSGFNMTAGDVNNDGTITMSDANQIVNMFLTGSTGSSANGHEYVDLGLSVKWATCNVGADNPWDYGDYFAWGETEPKNNYDWDTYKWGNGRNNYTYNKYNNDETYDTVDNKLTLESQDDAATANWGGAWRMPTVNELKALLDSCYWEWTASYNDKSVKGYIVYKVKDHKDMGKRKSGVNNITEAAYSLSDTHIFLPAAGYRYYKYCEFARMFGFYWSASLYENYPESAWYVYFDSSGENTTNIKTHFRFEAITVRPVCP